MISYLIENPNKYDTFPLKISKIQRTENVSLKLKTCWKSGIVLVFVMYKSQNTHLMS